MDPGRGGQLEVREMNEVGCSLSLQRGRGMISREVILNARTSASIQQKF